MDRLEEKRVMESGRCCYVVRAQQRDLGKLDGWVTWGVGVFKIPKKQQDFGLTKVLDVTLGGEPKWRPDVGSWRGTGRGAGWTEHRSLMSW